MKFSAFDPIQQREVDFPCGKQVVVRDEFITLTAFNLEVTVRADNPYEAKALGEVAKMANGIEHPARTLDRRLYLARLSGMYPWTNVLAMQDKIIHDMYRDELRDE